MKRPLVFALELLAALTLATVGAWIADKVGRKVNAKSNADVRSSFALQALVEVERERLAFEKAQAVVATPPRPVAKRRKLLPTEEKFLNEHQECWDVAYMGADLEIHPVHCRP